MKTNSIESTLIDLTPARGGFVCHFLSLINEADKIEAAKNTSDTFGVDTQYEIALVKAKKIGGKRYHNKNYGGGILFSGFSKSELEAKIAELQHS